MVCRFPGWSRPVARVPCRGSDKGAAASLLQSGYYSNETAPQGYPRLNNPTWVGLLLFAKRWSSFLVSVLAVQTLSGRRRPFGMGPGWASKARCHPAGRHGPVDYVGSANNKTYSFDVAHDLRPARFLALKLVYCGVSNVSPRSANASGSLREPQRPGGRQWFARQI